MSEHSHDGWIAKIEKYNRYSQFGEDGILNAIFEKIGVSNRPYCVDVGAADGILFSNVRQWLERDWEGLLIEKDADRFGKLCKNTERFGFDKVKCQNYEVQSDGYYRLDFILDRAEVPQEFDLLSIDIDGQDYYVWNSLLKYFPRVVVIEYDPEVDPMFIPIPGGQGQAGWNALTYVAAARGYLTVARTHTNLICVRKDIAEKTFNCEIKYSADLQSNAQQNTERLDIAKPSSEVSKPVQVTAVISVPRLGINANWHSTIQAVIALGLKVQLVEGAFWGQCLTRGINQAINEGADVILTIDYDSVFTPTHVIKLLQLLYDQTEYDCIVPMQIKRECNEMLFQTDGDKEFDKPLTNILTGHFGLTVFDAKAFAKLPKPWFHAQPDPAGGWDDGRTDEDIYFWSQWRKAGLKLASANEVKIGHLEFMVTWPTKDMKIYRQSVTDYRKKGQPDFCGGDLKIETLGD
jgi:hypothetical protein